MVERDTTSVEVVASLLATVEIDRHYYQQILSELPVPLAVVSEDLSIAFANNAFRHCFASALGRGTRRDLLEIECLAPLADLAREVLWSGQSVARYAMEGGCRSLLVSLRRLAGRGSDSGSEVLLLFEDCGRDQPGASIPSELVDGVDGIVWELDVRKWRYLFVNQRAEELLGFPTAQWLNGPPMLSHVQLQDREWVESTYRAAAAGSGSSTCEYRAVTADGRSLWLQDFLRSGGEGPGGSLLLRGLTVDITARKQKESKVREALRIDLLGELARRAADQIGREVSVLGRHGDNALQLLPPLHPLRAPLIEMLVAASRLAELRDEFLEFSRKPDPQQAASASPGHTAPSR